MSRKHRQRADNRPVTRRYVARVVQRARDDIISAVVHGSPTPEAIVHRTVKLADVEAAE